MCRAGRGSGAVTSPRPPRCSSRGPSRRRARDRGTCAASPGQTPWRWSQSPSSLSSFSVFGLPGLLETVGGRRRHKFRHPDFPLPFFPFTHIKGEGPCGPSPKKFGSRSQKIFAARSHKVFSSRSKVMLRSWSKLQLTFLKPVWWNLQCNWAPSPQFWDFGLFNSTGSGFQLWE